MARFAKVAAGCAARTAICGNGEHWTYSELDRRSNQIGRAIREHAPPGSGCVAYLVDHSPHMVICALAILKASKTYLCIHPGWPLAAQQDVVRDAAPDLIVTDAAHAATVRDIVGDTCVILLLEQIDSRYSADALDPAVSPGDPAVIFYTSGSTGRPKGVVKSHRAILHRAWLCVQYDGICADDRVSLLTFCSFASSEADCFGALLNGAALELFDVASNGVTDLGSWIDRRAVTMLHPPVVLFRRYLSTLAGTGLHPSVRLVALAGEAVTAADVALWRRHFAAACELRHRFSSTEAGHIAVACLAGSAQPASEIIPPARPVTDKFLSVVDENGREVKPGEAGELIVSSAFMADGYWRAAGRPDDPFEADPEHPGRRLVHTGDIVRPVAGGGFEFVGRRDTQVKIRGYRVETGEIEDAFQKLPGVQEAAIVVENRHDQNQLVSFVVMKPGESPPAGALRSALRTILPSWKIPARICQIESLPLTLTGKIDRTRLRSIEADRVQRNDDPPVTPTEIALAAIWEKMLDMHDIGRGESFLDLGGDSLMAAMAAARVHAVLGVALPIRAFTDHPTLAELADFIDSTRRSGSAPQAPEVIALPRERPLPLSFQQERIWRYSITPAQSADHTYHRCFRILGPLDRDLLRRSMESVARRHDTLRMSVATANGEPVQIIHSATGEVLLFVDLDGQPDAESKAMELCVRESARVFDLGEAPLYGFVLLRIRDGEHWLLRVMHHILFDAWSMRLYFRELTLSYEAALRGESPPLPEVAPLQYGDYAAWQRRAMRPEMQEYRQKLEWWRTRLADCPPAPVRPFQRAAAPAHAEPADGSMMWGVDAEVSERLNGLARQQRVSFYVARLAVLVAGLVREARTPRISLATYMSVRNRAGLEGVFGPFMNPVLLHFRFQGHLTFRQWLAVVHEAVVAAEANGDVPHDQLCDWLAARGQAVPEIKLIFAARQDAAPRIADLAIRRIYMPARRMPWGMSIVMDEQDEAQNCEYQFDAAIYDPQLVTRFIGRLRRMLATFAADPDLPMETLLADAT